MFPVMEMTGSSKRLMKGRRVRSSVVSPEKDMAMQTSPSWTMPRSPCRAFRESSMTVGVPVEFRVATILAPTLPDFPTPAMTILLPRSRARDMRSTALLKFSSSRDRTPRSSSISISKTDLARVKWFISGGNDARGPFFRQFFIAAPPPLRSCICRWGWDAGE